MKNKKLLKIFVIGILLINLVFPCFAYEEDPDAWDYIWLDEAIEESKKDEQPSILSKYVAVYDRNSKTIIWGKNENTQTPMASTTKIMTATIMMEQIGEENLNTEIEVCEEAANTIGSRLGLHTGDKITYNDLLYGLLLCSGNDAAVQIAISVAGSVENFAELMNKKAEELGLENTHFVTPHGLDREGHYTTAAELAIIADNALNNKKISQVVNTREYIVTLNGYPKTISNTNELLGYLNGVNGIKTGYTSKAGRCLVTSCTRDDFNIIIVALGADTKKIRTQDSIKLIEYVYRNYKLADVEELVNSEYEQWCHANQKRIRVNKGAIRNPEIYIEEGKYTKYPLKEGEGIYIETTKNLKFDAPVLADTEVGRLIVKKNDTIIDEIAIRIKDDVPKKGMLYYFFQVMELINIII